MSDKSFRQFKGQLTSGDPDMVKCLFSYVAIYCYALQGWVGQKLQKKVSLNSDPFHIESKDLNPYSYDLGAEE